MKSDSSGMFSGSRTVFGNCRVSYGGKELDPRLDLFYHARDGFDWGYMGAGPLQLAFAMLVVVAGERVARDEKTEFAKEVIAKLDKKEWRISAEDVETWLQRHSAEVKKPVSKRRGKSSEENVVKSVCKELGMTQKRLAEILEVPEGTVSSWAVKNEIPRLGKKAIEFYIASKKHEAVVEKFREIIRLVNEG